MAISHADREGVKRQKGKWVEHTEAAVRKVPNPERFLGSSPLAASLRRRHAEEVGLGEVAGLDLTVPAERVAPPELGRRLPRLPILSPRGAAGFGRRVRADERGHQRDKAVVRLVETDDDGGARLSGVAPDEPGATVAAAATARVDDLVPVSRVDAGRVADDSAHLDDLAEVAIDEVGHAEFRECLDHHRTHLRVRREVVRTHLREDRGPVGEHADMVATFGDGECEKSGSHGFSSL